MTKPFDPADYPLISETEIEYALAFHGLPPWYRNPTPVTLRVHQIVCKIKAEIQLRRSCLSEWEELRDLIDTAEMGGMLPAVFDDLTKAWTLGKPDLDTLLLWGGDLRDALQNYQQVSKKFENSRIEASGIARESVTSKDRIYTLDAAAEKRLKRRYKTWMVVDCIKRLQFQLKRVPTRNEIMDNYALQDPEGQISADELTRQLTVLGWKKRILPEKFKKVFDVTNAGRDKEL